MSEEKKKVMMLYGGWFTSRNLQCDLPWLWVYCMRTPSCKGSVVSRLPRFALHTLLMIGEVHHLKEAEEQARLTLRSDSAWALRAQAARYLLAIGPADHNVFAAVEDLRGELERGIDFEDPGGLYPAPSYIDQTAAEIELCVLDRWMIGIPPDEKSDELILNDMSEE